MMDSWSGSLDVGYLFWDVDGRYVARLVMCKCAIKIRTKSRKLGNTFSCGFGTQELLDEFPNPSLLLKT